MQILGPVSMTLLLWKISLTRFLLSTNLFPACFREYSELLFIPGLRIIFQIWYFPKIRFYTLSKNSTKTLLNMEVLNSRL